tara:strand:- start:1028 stop:1228 length:201 start_codon:yes stop_codon:yes gene_type:complete
MRVSDTPCPLVATLAHMRLYRATVNSQGLQHALPFANLTPRPKPRRKTFHSPPLAKAKAKAYDGLP